MNTGPVGVFVVDANNDGVPDLVINTMRTVPSANKSFLSLNDGHGNFTTTQLAGDALVQAAGDFNSDGNLDFSLSSSGSQVILFGDGQGGILFAPTQRTCFNAPGPDVHFAADFDHNLTVDLVANDVYFPGNGHGGFGSSISFTPDPLTNLALGDFNGDGRPDMVIASQSSLVTTKINNLATPVSILAFANAVGIPSASNTSVGQPITVSTFVNSSCGVPTGTVTYSEGSTTLGSAPVNIYGQAALDLTFSTGGVHTITPVFTGSLDPATNTVYGNSTSPPITRRTRSPHRASADGHADRFSQSRARAQPHHLDGFGHRPFRSS